MGDAFQYYVLDAVHALRDGKKSAYGTLEASIRGCLVTFAWLGEVHTVTNEEVERWRREYMQLTTEKQQKPWRND